MIAMKEQDRPVITLFRLMSVDGKISTGATKEFAFQSNVSE